MRFNQSAVTNKSVYYMEALGIACLPGTTVIDRAERKTLYGKDCVVVLKYGLCWSIRLEDIDTLDLYKKEVTRILKCGGLTSSEVLGLFRDLKKYSDRKLYDQLPETDAVNWPRLSIQRSLEIQERRWSGITDPEYSGWNLRLTRDEIREVFRVA